MRLKNSWCTPYPPTHVLDPFNFAFDHVSNVKVHSSYISWYVYPHCARYCQPVTTATWGPGRQRLFPLSPLPPQSVSPAIQAFSATTCPLLYAQTNVNRLHR